MIFYWKTILELVLTILVFIRAITEIINEMVLLHGPL